MIRERFRSWRRELVKTMAPLSWEERALYIWDYYRLWVIGIVTVVFVLVSGIHQYVSTNPENWFFACFANTRAELGEGSRFWKEYARYAGYDLREKNLTFQDSCYCDPIGNPRSQYYQLLIAYLDSGTLDVLVMEKDRLLAIGSSGRLMDLEDARVAGICEKYRDRLVYCEPVEGDYGKESVPVGIDLAGSILTEEYSAYTEEAVLGISALAPHPEEAETFLAYLFEQ